MIQTSFKIRGTKIIGITLTTHTTSTPKQNNNRRLHKKQETRFNINHKTMKITGLINIRTQKTRHIYRVKKCKWCGRKFNPAISSQKYCTTTCRHYGDQEQTMNRVRRYRHKYKEILRETITNTRIGTGRLGQHMSKDWNEEMNKIRKEMRELGLNNPLSY